MRRELGTGLLVLVLALAVVGSGGFSAASADRGATVTVADDESAYVGVDAEGCTIANNFDHEVTVTLGSDDGDEQSFDLDPGESGEVEATGETSVSVEGSGISAELERPFDCGEEENEDADEEDADGEVSEDDDVGGDAEPGDDDSETGEDGADGSTAEDGFETEPTDDETVDANDTNDDDDEEVELREPVDD